MEVDKIVSILKIIPEALDVTLIITRQSNITSAKITIRIEVDSVNPAKYMNLIQEANNNLIDLKCNNITLTSNSEGAYLYGFLKFQ